MKNIFKCGCASISKIMTDPKGKSNLEKYNDLVELIAKDESRYMAMKDTAATKPKLLEKIERCSRELERLETIKHEVYLSETCKSHIREWVDKVCFDRRKEVKTKQLTKGIYAEEDSITNVSIHLSRFFQKNTNRYSNSFLRGEPDIINDSIVIDIKTSWDLSTFPLLDDAIPDIGYEWQLLGYMALLNDPETKATDLDGKETACNYKPKQAQVIYSLTDAPLWTIRDEIRKLGYGAIRDTDDGMITANMKYNIIQKMVYTLDGWKLACIDSDIVEEGYQFKEIQIEERVNIFDVEYDSDRIEMIKERVKLINQYIRDNKKISYLLGKYTNLLKTETDGING